jgi:hypothetical protein
MGATSRNGHAIIIGASIGGLMAAAAVSGSFERITIIDRDELPATPAPRRGVPQSRLTHGLTARGEMALGELFPGLVGELAAIGVPIRDGQSDVSWYIDGRRLKRAVSGLPVVCASRPLLEFALRSRVAVLPGVTIIGRHDVTGLLATSDCSAVTGVQLRSRDGAGPPSSIAADLVVDATGLGTGSASWLKELGYVPPEEETVRVGICYSCWLFRDDGDARYLDAGVITVVAAYPDSPLGGLALAQEGGRFILALNSRGNVMPPTGLAEMAIYADTLPTRDLAEIIRTATPLGEPATMRFPASVRRRYERLDHFLGGFLAIGDALCCLNPCTARACPQRRLRPRCCGACSATGGRISLHGSFTRPRRSWTFRGPRCSATTSASPVPKDRAHRNWNALASTWKPSGRPPRMTWCCPRPWCGC